MAGEVGSDEHGEGGDQVYDWVTHGGEFEAGEGAVVPGYWGEYEELDEYSDYAADGVEEADSLGVLNGVGC